MSQEELTIFRARSRRLKQLLIGAGLALAFIGSAVASEVDLVKFFTSLGSAVEVLQWMFPPDWTAFGEMVEPALMTLEMAFMGTLFGAALSFLVGLGAASNIAPPMVRRIARGAIQVERALPDLVVVLLFVAAVGFGPFAGVMALGVCSIGMLGKLLADAIEEVDPRPVEALESVGATKLQQIRYGILPQTIPTFVADVIYRFDINIRFSVLLGAVGAGGIGYVLIILMSTLEYEKAMTAVISILVLIIACQQISDAIRKGIVGEEGLK